MLFGREHAKRLLFRHPAPSYHHLYKDFFKLEVKFGQPCDAIEISRALLSRKLHGAFPELHKQAESHLKRKIALIPSGISFAGQVERSFSDSPSLFSHGIEGIAATLRLPVRTLQRRLQAEDQSFAGLLACSRYRLARTLLQETSLDLETVAELLGFSERRAFTRAFTQWSGQSPSDYRSQSAEKSEGQ